MNEKLQISFLESDAQHQNTSNYYDNTDIISIYELALELEENYQVIKTFIDKYNYKITEIVAKELIYNTFNDEDINQSKKIIANAIKNIWLDYMEKGEHNIVSKRAKETGTVGLIDTGQYYNSMIIAVDDITSTGEF